MNKWKDLTTKRWKDLEHITWREVRLEEIADINMGQSPKSIYYNNLGEGIRFLQGNRTFGRIYPTFDTYTTKITKLANKGDILFTVRAPVGDMNIANYDLCIGRGIVAIRGKENHKFLYYSLIHNTELLKTAENGTTYGSINKSDLENFKIKIPDLETQEKIADILSTYDRLIENNNRRIEILEKTAEEIYKEWFVRMRFPGYENTKFIKGIPEGWEVKKIGNIISKLESGKRQKSNNEEEKTVVSLGAGDIKGLGEYSNSNEYLIPYTFFKEMNKGVVEDKDIAIYKDGAYTGKTTMFRDQFPYSEIAVNEHVFLVQCKDYKLQNYLLFTLMQNSYFDLMQILSMTSAQPGLNQSKFKNIKIEVPTKNLIDEFYGISEIHLKEIFNLAKQNQNLIKQRDLLLPRLMNGTIEVK